MIRLEGLSLRGVGKRLEEFDLFVPDLSVESGELFGVIGPSGCGKTTLLRLIAGLLRTDEGVISCGGMDVTGLPAESRNMGVVFQRPVLFPYMTVMGNLTFGLKMRGVSREERLSRGLELLPALGLDGLGDRYPDELSGGEAQRVAIGRAVIFRPVVLLMDEPFSSLDPNLRGVMRRLVRGLHDSMGMTTVFVSHDRDDAFDLFDRCAFLLNGRVVEIGTPRKLYEKPEKRSTAEFMGISNAVPSTMSNGPDGD